MEEKELASLFITLVLSVRLCDEVMLEDLICSPSISALEMSYHGCSYNMGGV